MTFPTYADPVPTPAPLTSGTTIQSFTDPLGDVWVAKNGVNGGNWLRARDVLGARIHRAAALSNVTINNYVQLPFDTATDDIYGMATLGTNALITVPIAGRYLVSGRYDVSPSVATRLIGAIYKATPPGAATEYSRGNDTTTATAPLSSVAVDVIRAAAGDTFQLNYWISAALAFTVGPAICRFTVQYLGTG